MQELINREQLLNLVRNFYTKIREDDLLGPIFNDIAQVDWEHHIQILTDFWSNIMLKTNSYKGSPYSIHMELARKITVSDEHFKRWLFIFEQQAKEDLAPQVAEIIINRANLIGESLKIGMVGETLNRVE